MIVGSYFPHKVADLKWSRLVLNPSGSKVTSVIGFPSYDTEAESTKVERVQQNEWEVFFLSDNGVSSTGPPPNR